MKAQLEEIGTQFGDLARDQKVLGFTESAIVLGSVVILFVAFVVIQFQYFFGGQTNIGVAGYTYSEYARKGFGELVATGFFSLLLFLGLSTIVKRQTVAQHWIFSGLGMAMVILVGVMLLAATATAQSPAWKPEKNVEIVVGLTPRYYLRQIVEQLRKVASASPRLAPRPM